MNRWHLLSRLPLSRLTVTRFVVLAFLCQFLVTSGVLLFVQQSSKRAAIEAEAQTAHDLRDELVEIWRIGGQGALAQAIRARLKAAPNEPVALLLADGRGRALAGNLGAWPATLGDGRGWQAISLYRVGRADAEPIGVTTQRLGDGNRLLTGVVMSDSLRLTAIYEEALTIAFVASLTLTFGVAIILGRLLARQVSAIAETANDVGYGALHRRVETDGSGDAFDRLGRSINAMLERIDTLVSQLRMMTDGLAHDLKSPVTRLVAVVEQAIVRTQDGAALDALDAVRREAETLQAMLSTALLISRTEAGFGADMLKQTDIDDLLRDLAEIYGPLVEESGFDLLVSAPAGLRFPLHRDLVSRALANLVENAVHYAEGGNRIALTARIDAASDGLVLIVADNGPGIPAAQHADAMKRFGRLDPARAKPGSGLGLALVEAVARLHKGQVALSDNEPGLQVIMRLGGVVAEA